MKHLSTFDTLSSIRSKAHTFVNNTSLLWFSSLIVHSNTARHSLMAQTNTDLGCGPFPAFLLAPWLVGTLPRPTKTGQSGQPRPLPGKPLLDDGLGEPRKRTSGSRSLPTGDNNNNGGRERLLAPVSIKANSHESKHQILLIFASVRIGTIPLLSGWLGSDLGQGVPQKGLG